MTIDVSSTQAISIKLAPGQVHDTYYLYEQLRDDEVRETIDKVLADSDYDCSWHFNLLRRRGMAPGIKR